MLHVKHRPKTLDEFFGNEALKESLADILKRPVNEMPRAYLFYGKRGAGKTTLANILKNQLDAEAEYVTGSGVDDIRELLTQVKYGSMVKDNKIFIIDEAHRLSTKAVDELLVEIEEPREGIFFILCTNEHLKLPETLRSRLMPFEVKNLSKEESLKFLTFICKKEKIKPAKKSLTYLASRFEGNPRDMLVALDKVKSFVSSFSKVKKAIDELSKDDVEIIDLLRILLKKPINGASSKIMMFQEALSRCHEKIKKDPELARMVIGRYMSKVAMNPSNWQVAGDLGELLIELGEPFYYTGADIKLIGILLKMHKILLEEKWV